MVAPGTTIYPGWLFFERKGDAEQHQETLIDEDDGSRQFILCAACKAPVTSPQAKIEVRGDHHHSFFNPQGIVFTIGCFSMAPGCRDLGKPSSEFSWFPAYRWIVSGCGRCDQHLGWRFVSGDSGFFGLILDRLLEVSEKHC